MLYFMLTGYLPFTAQSETATQMNIMRGKYNPLPDTLSPGVKDLVQRMLRVNPLERIKLNEILEHEWFVQGLNLADLFPWYKRLKEGMMSPIGSPRGRLQSGSNASMWARLDSPGIEDNPHQQSHVRATSS